MRSQWRRLPPVRERRLADHVRWGLVVLAGALLAYLVSGAGDPSVLAGCIAGVLLVIVGLTLWRRAAVRRRTGGGRPRVTPLGRASAPRSTDEFRPSARSNGRTASNDPSGDPP